MITGGGSEQQELFFLTLKKKVLHFSSCFIPSVDIYQQQEGDPRLSVLLVRYGEGRRRAGAR